MEALRALLAVCLVALCVVPLARAEEVERKRLVVYGATPAGIMAAYAAAKEGMQVTLVEPTRHVGGVVTSGLGGSDVCNPRTVSGLAKKFFKKVSRRYSRTSWNFEPHVAEEVFLSMLEEVGVAPLLGRSVTAVKKEGGRILSKTLDTGEVISGDVFIDASYEGDLLARAGVPYSVGREAQSEFGEPSAGVRPSSARKQRFGIAVSGRDSRGGLLRGVHLDKLPPLGSGDAKVMAYCYRLVVCTDPVRHVSVTAPPEYDPADYEILGRYIRAGKIYSLNQLFTFLPVGKQKYDLNSGGLFSTNYVGESWRYPDASYEERRDIIRAHERYTRGLIHYLQTEERIPPALRRLAGRIGLCNDEFADNNYWPYQLYVREARRMKGEYVLTEHDLVKGRERPDGVALSSCPIESHAVQRYVDEHGNVNGEGGVERPVALYQIPYGSIVPRRQDVTNLLVPVAVSASHIAYSSLRMEPVFMSLGQVAGLAAMIAAERQIAVQDVSLETLHSTLRKRGLQYGVSQPRPAREEGPQ